MINFVEYPDTWYIPSNEVPVVFGLSPDITLDEFISWRLYCKLSIWKGGPQSETYRIDTLILEFNDPNEEVLFRLKYL